MRLKLFIMVLMVVALLLPAVGCNQLEPAAEGDQEVEEMEAAESVETDHSDGVIMVTDQMGREVVIEEIPQRIISISPSNTEIAFALGLEDRIVGVTEYCNYPSEALEKEDVGGFASPSIEKIVELEPDLILASTIHEEEVPRLEELGISVLVIESSNLIELYTSISLVAEITGVPANGEQLIASMQQRIQVVEVAVAEIPEEDRVDVFYEVYSEPLMSAGSGAFINEIITLAGGINIFGDIEEDYPQISAEVVAEKQPDIILFPDYHGTAKTILEEMAGRPGWESIPAVQNEQVYAISDDAFARPGPRVVEAVEEAAKIFYPDLF
ncbi:MAG: ABC transporter substrate-binding protein [Bacillota bacterium]